MPVAGVFKDVAGATKRPRNRSNPSRLAVDVSVGRRGCWIRAHRWRSSENRSLPCLNPARDFFFPTLWRCILINVDTHDKHTQHAGLTGRTEMLLAYRTVKTPRIWPRYLRLGPTLPGANFARKVPLFKSYSVSNDSPSMLRF